MTRSAAKKALIVLAVGGLVAAFFVFDLGRYLTLSYMIPAGGAGLPADPQAVPGDTIVEGSIGGASNLLPALASDSSSFDVIGLVYNRLVRYDKDLNLEGDLAERWEVSPDGLVITFHLRRGVQWHDGNPSPRPTWSSPGGS